MDRRQPARGHPLRRRHARRARRAARSGTARRRRTCCRRSTAGIVGWMGYDTVREIERLPDVPHRRSRSPRRGAARSRARSPRSTTSASAASSSRTSTRRRAATDATLREHYDAAVARLADAVAELGRPLPYVPVAAARRRAHRAARGAHQPRRARSGPRRSRPRRSTSSRATSSRSCSRSASISSSRSTRSRCTACCGS